MGDFEEWYLAEHRRVLGVCLVVAGNRDLAQEATDEAFARALERWATVSTMTAPGAWVQVVALNHLRRMLRRRRLGIAFDAQPRSVLPAVELRLPNPELWEAVRALPDRQRVMIVLRYVGDRPEPDIAAALGTSRGNVARTLHDARVRLRSRLEERTAMEPVDDRT